MATMTPTTTSNADCDFDVLDLDDLIDRLLQLKDKRPGTLVELKEEEIVSLCARTRERFLSEPMLLRPEAPIRICGDLHGQYFDLMRIFDHGGKPPKSNYLFLGDYCDRGKQSIEVLCLLFAYKLKYPDKMHLLRGNHESQRVSRMYGFYDECKRRYSVKLWKRFCEAFDCMPCAAVVSDTILCVHGGLSPELTTLEQIDSIERPTDIPDAGLLCDLLWSDPEPDITGWEESDRGVSYVFGEDVVQKFLDENDLDVLVRAHQVVEDGYEFFSGRKLVTIFSAPNYCGEFDNCGATMVVSTDMKCHFQLLKPTKKSRRPKINKKTLTPIQKLRKESHKIKIAMTAFGKISAEDYRKTLSVRKISNEAELAVDHRSYKRSASARSLNANFSSSSTITSASASPSVDSSLISSSDTNSTSASTSTRRRSSLLSKSDATDFSRVRFQTSNLILETEDLTQRNTSWGDLWEDLYYDQDALAEFRHEAFLEECELDESG